MNTDYLLDLARRVGGAFVSALLSALLVGVGEPDAFSVVDAEWGTALSVAAGATVLSLLKGLAAKLRGNPADASLMRTPEGGRHGG